MIKGKIIIGLFGLILLSGCITNTRFSQEYWDELALNDYIITKYTHIDKSGGGSGWLHYSQNGRDYVIHCYQKEFDKLSVGYCCKEGEVKWGTKYLSETIDWINITYESGCY